MGLLMFVVSRATHGRNFMTETNAGADRVSREQVGHIIPPNLDRAGKRNAFGCKLADATNRGHLQSEFSRKKLKLTKRRLDGAVVEVAGASPLMLGVSTTRFVEFDLSL
jgi:hypothetical protein